MLEKLVWSEGLEFFVSDASHADSDRFESSHGSVRLPQEVVENNTAKEIGQAVKDASELIPVLYIRGRVYEIYSQVYDPVGAPRSLRQKVVSTFKGLDDAQRDKIDDDTLSKIHEIRASMKPSYRTSNNGAANKSSSRTAQRGYVYIACAAGKHKIGRSKKPSDRIDHFDVQMPVDVREVHRFKADDYVRAEQRLHDRYSVKRVNGEWFDLSQKQIDLLRTIDKYEDGTFYDANESEMPEVQP